VSRLTTCGLTILLAYAPAALAVDGTVLINQSTITNGLTGCPTGGHFPIVICQSGSYRLSGNLTVPANTDAIDINTDNVTLDLNGFSIVGPVVCSGSPVTSCTEGTSPSAGINSNNSYITVSNGIVRGFDPYGINLTGAGVQIERITAVSNGNTGINTQISLLGAGDAIVTLCHGNSNGFAGIDGAGTLSNSSAVNNKSTGVVWFGSATGNISSGNGSDGFGGLGVFMSNVAVGNVSSGINATSPSVIISNGFYSNGAAINAVSGSVVLNNVAK
jgi:hypothetical protein